MTCIVLLGIAHRDLKPDNILCVHSDRLVPIKLIDFDLASSFMLDGNGSDVVTTPRLRSPVSNHVYRVLLLSRLVIMAILRSRCGHYIFALWFLLSFFFPRLILVIGYWMSSLPYFHTWCGLSANLGCRSETCCTRLAETQDAKNRHLSTIVQLCRAIS